MQRRPDSSHPPVLLREQLVGLGLLLAQLLLHAAEDGAVVAQTARHLLQLSQGALWRKHTKVLCSAWRTDTVPAACCPSPRSFPPPASH